MESIGIPSRHCKRPRFPSRFPGSSPPCHGKPAMGRWMVRSSNQMIYKWFINDDRWDFHGIIELNEDSEWDSMGFLPKVKLLGFLFASLLHVTVLSIRPSPLDQGGLDQVLTASSALHALHLLEFRLQSAGQELHKFRGQGVVRTTTVWPGMVTGHHESPRMFLLAFGTPSNIWRIGRMMLL